VTAGSGERRSDGDGPREHQRIWPGDASRGEIEVVEERVVWQNPVVRLYDDRVRLPATRDGEHVEHCEFRLAHAPDKVDGVVIVPITHDDHILLVRQFRHPPRMWLRELPRGGREADETPEAAAARELKEEIGRTAESLHPLGRVAPDSGQLAGCPYLFAARVGARGADEREETEAIDRVIAYRYGALRAACEAGEILDSFTLAAVLRLAPHFDGDRFAYRAERAPKQEL